MGDFIQAFLEWISDKTGFSNTGSATLSTVVVALLVWIIQSGIKKGWAWYRATKAAKDLHPHFDSQSVQKATQYYIPTHFQNASPSRQDELKETLELVSRSPMIPFFIKKGFNERKDSERFYLVLADSGMGKTTFMINLYIKYYSLWNWRRKYEMKLFRFSHPDTLPQIKEIKSEEAKKTILLLDALDEDSNIVSKDPNVSDTEAFEKRVDEFIEASRNFREVVISCRTQYFPGQEDDPYEVNFKRPDGKGFYVFKKLYLSPFTEQEVKQYLNKKFGYLSPWNWPRKKRAAQMVGKADYLMIRPMLLSYIDYLVEEKGLFNTNYDIYKTLIDKWLVREAEKRKKKRDQPMFIENLRKVSLQVALIIFEKWGAENRLYLTKEEILAVTQKYNIDLKPEEVTGQSLLTCDANRNWKFAHKSILEFFLAKEAIQDLDSFVKMDFTGMDMAKRFYLEKGNFVFVEGGVFQMGIVSSEIELSSFWIGKYPVTQEEYEKVTGKNPSIFKGNPKNPVEQVIWNEAIEFCNQLNIQYGYSKTYDSKGNLLDTSGQITKDITKVYGFRLPTEAEWEYAARGGNQSKGFQYSGSNNVKEVAWYFINSKKSTHPVGQLQPNELGIYDMSGNVEEWCYDWYGELPGTKRQNPIGPDSGSNRVYRGGSWNFGAEFCRSAYRRHNDPDYRYGDLGFRLVFVPQF